jgi:hypothetical protein
VSERQRAIKAMRRMRAEGLSLRKIAAAIAENRPALSHVAVQRVLAEAAPV